MRELFLGELDRSVGRRAGLERALRAMIADGRLRAGSELPSSRVLAADLEFSRATVVAAYEQLAVEGYLVARHGSGTRVADVTNLVHASRPEPPPRLSLQHDFRPGSPSVGLFPRAAWLRSVRRAVTDSPDSLFDYGDPRGLPALRTSLVDYLRRARAVSAEPDDVAIYGGFFAAAGFIAEALRRVGVERIAVEDPSLPIVRQVATLVGLEVVGIPVDEHGIVVDRLAAESVGAVIVTPAHQFPLGVTLAPHRRSALVEWARKTGAWIVEDDYDGEFRYDRQPVGALQGLAPDVVVYAGTASKALAPGLRIAWLVVPEGLRAAIHAVTQLRAGVSAVDQCALADFIERGEFERTVRSARTTYRRRREALLERILADVTWLAPLSSDGEAPIAAGLHVTLAPSADQRLDEAAIVESGAASSIGLLGLGSLAVGPSRLAGLVLGYTRLPEHRFAESLDKLIIHLASHG